MTISEELEKTLQRAFKQARLMAHEFVTPEHLLVALIDDEVAGPALYNSGGNLEKLKKDVVTFLEERMPKVPINSVGLTPDPQYSIGAQYVLQLAAAQIQSSGRQIIDGGALLVALFREEESHAVYYLHQQNITQLDIMRFLSHGTY